ncbi:MAG TPA: hypothetical protein VH105_09280 [Burkholderiales bacterium]|jgi:hypothetical protein|nr:hypothetical protein [Burkholderiales bacterium]
MTIDPDYSNPFDRGPIGNHPGQFLCPICRSESFNLVTSYTRDGRSKVTSLYQCRGCTVVFTNVEAFMKRRRFTLRKMFNCNVYTAHEVEPYDPEKPDEAPPGEK